MNYLYYYVRHMDEREVCELEMRALFGQSSNAPYIVTERCIEPSRSPFTKGRLAIWIEADTEDHLIERVASYSFKADETYKLTCLNEVDFDDEKKWSHTQRRHIERSVGSAITAEVDLHNPTVELGVIYLEGTYYFGAVQKGEAVWFHHQQKPRMYSTALSSRLARAIVNIAVPHIEAVEKVIDPCCGIGTVLVEALSMGVPIEGSDVNPLVCDGSRENIAHFGYETSVTLCPIERVEGQYDVAIIDLPYNLFTHVTDEQLTSILESAYRIASRVVFVAIESVEEQLQQIGFTIVDEAIARKAKFERKIIVCER